MKRVETLLRITNNKYKARHSRVILLFKVCVRLVLEYACSIWNDASEHLKTSQIDSIQHRVLARAMGVRRATSREALEVETGGAPRASQGLQPAPWAKKLPRWVVSTIAGMRLGNSATRSDLLRSGLSRSPVCDCKVYDETRAHYWLSCSREKNYGLKCHRSS